MEDQSELRLQAWEMGLPSPEDLTPLSQSLISPQLASAFGITTHDNNNNSRAHFDLNRVMHDEDNNNNNNINNCFDSFNLRLFPGRTSSDHYKRGGPDYYGPDEANSGSTGDETGLNRAMKRPRLVWTPKLHKRFVDVIEHLGIDKAVPKTIMEMMNVDGLTRENVASHLQKYRLYLKRVEGGVPCSEGYSSSSSKRDPPFFDCEGFSGNFSLSQQQQQQQQQQQGFCNSLNLMQMAMVGPPGPGYGGGGYGHLGLNVGSSNPSGYCGLESGGYSVFWNRQRG